MFALICLASLNVCYSIHLTFLLSGLNSCVNFNLHLAVQYMDSEIKIVAIIASIFHLSILFYVLSYHLLFRSMQNRACQLPDAFIYMWYY